jgi:hypothetical protein
LWVAGIAVEEETEAGGDVGLDFVGAAAEHVTVLEEGGQRTRRPAPVGGDGADDHAGQAGVQRQLGHLPAGGGGAAIVVEAAEEVEEASAFLQGSGRWRVEEWE